MALWLPGCGGNQDTEPQAEIVIPEGEAQHSVIVPVGDAEAVAVELRFFGISDLHRGFFGDPRFVGQLGQELGQCVSGTAQVIVSYDEETRVGRIVLKAPPDGVTCMPGVSGKTVDLQPLQPLGMALANYRDSVAANFDFRVASFKVGASFTRGSKQCNLQIAGSHPPDGRRWSPCVGFAGTDKCGAGDVKAGVVELEFPARADASYLAACFAR